MDEKWVRKKIELMKNVQGKKTTLFFYLSLSLYFPDFKECLPLFQKVERDLWSKFLVQASKDAKWTSIKLVVIGPLNGVPLANDFDASQISLSTLFDTLKSEEYLRKPCHMMLLKLLKQGAEIQTLSQNPDEIFHILVKLVLLTRKIFFFSLTYHFVFSLTYHFP